MKFALVSADPTHKKRFRIDCEGGDCTSFMNWVDVLGGLHLSYLKLREEDMSYLKDFDVVMMSGHPGHMTDIVRIAEFLKDSKTVSMFYPEGSWQLYDGSIRTFHREYLDAWNACDILSIAEEEKEDYYRAFIRTETIVRFIHVPLREEMASGAFYLPRNMKSNRVLVYGDNNPNHPAIAIACAAQIGATVMTVECGTAWKDFLAMFPKMHFVLSDKCGQHPFLRRLGSTLIHFYPTEWIGTSREAIACALVGTPCVGSALSHTQIRLFPQFAHLPTDVSGMVESAKKILEMTNEEYDRMTLAALNAAQYYNLHNTMARFLSAVSDARTVKQRVRVPVA